jgi:uncharacterized RDD family membrane protein YckC
MMREISTVPNLLKRFLSALIDYSIVFGFFYAYVRTFGTETTDGYVVTGFPALIPIVFWFFYIILLEVFYGATIGNSIVGLKPVSLINHNGELSFSQSIKRHLLDPIDMFPFGIIGILTISNTDKNQRLGDLWAKTVVINT